MPREAKFTGKCKVCGMAITIGDTIRQYDGGHWCINDECARTAKKKPQAPVQAKPSGETNGTTAGGNTPSLSEAFGRIEQFAAIHDKAWALAINKARSDFPTATSYEDLRNLNIHAGLIYKSVIEYVLRA